MKHTPGPWEVKEYKNKTLFVKRVADTIPITGAHMSKANACLIAAAPDLLEACKEMITFYEDKELMPPDKFPAMWERVREAILKAERG